MKPTKSNRTIFLFVQIATVALFLGRAWQHIYWDAPFRTLLWDMEWMRWLIEGTTNYTWKEYVTSPEVDASIQNLIQVNGYFYLICALIALFINKIPKILGRVLILGSAFLMILGLLYMKERFFHLGQFLEYSLQFCTPLFLYYLRYSQEISERFWFIVKIAIVLTFTCHGLYAIGYYPRPELFMSMTMNILGTSEELTKLFLNIAGILDFILSILIFFNRKIAIWAVLYAVFWGFMTSIARIWANVYWEFWTDSMLQWGHECLYRFPHFLIPLALFWYWYYLDEEKKELA